VNRIEKLTLRFGSHAGSSVFAGYPDVEIGRSGGLIPASPAAWSNAPTVRPKPGASFESIAVFHKFPKRFHGDGPVTAIAIAADSPFDSVDMVIGTATERNRHRISVGSPFLGVIDEDADVYFAPSGSTPLLQRPLDLAGVQNARMDLNTLWWDCIAPVTAAAEDSLDSLTYPCRLNVYRGNHQLGGINSRGVYEADIEWEIVAVDGFATPSIPVMFTLTPGRRRVRVTAGIYQPNGGNASLAVRGIIGRKFGAFTDSVDSMAVDELLANSPLDAAAFTPTVFDYNDGNPYFAFLAAITEGTIGARGFLNVQAWDR